MNEPCERAPQPRNVEAMAPKHWLRMIEPRQAHERCSGQELIRDVELPVVGTTRPQCVEARMKRIHPARRLDGPGHDMHRRNHRHE